LPDCGLPAVGFFALVQDQARLCSASQLALSRSSGRSVLGHDRQHDLSAFCTLQARPRDPVPRLRFVQGCENQKRQRICKSVTF
jgi:hypothetical protein